MGIDILTLAAARAGKGSGGSASKYKQPDWGSETSIAEILPETELTADPDAGAALLMQEVTLVEGNVYTVKFNGTEYKCTAVYQELMTGVALGNVGAMIEGMPVTDDPFIFVTINEGDRVDFAGACAMVVPLDGSETFTLSIKGEVETVYEIPAKYTASKNALMVTTSNGEHASVNALRIKEAVEAGTLVYFKDMSGNVIPLCLMYSGGARFILMETSGAYFTVYQYDINNMGYITRVDCRLNGTTP